MRRSLLLLPSTFVLTGLSFFAGCISSSNNNPNPVPDASTPDVGTTTPDSGTLPDVEQPEAAPDAGPGPVTITVTRAGAPEANATVVFQDSQGAVIEAKTTDATGRASRVVDAGSMVTVVLTASGRRELFTFVAVEPGDNLLAFEPFDLQFSDPNTAALQMPLNAPAAAPQVSGVIGNSGCVAGDTAGVAAVNVPLFAECRGPTVTALALALDNNGIPIAGSFLKGQQFPAANGAVMGLPAWNTSLGSFNDTASNVPALNSLEMALTHVMDGQPWTQSRGTNVTANAGSTTFPTIPGLPEALQAEASVWIEDAGATVRRTRSIAERLANTATTRAFDMSQLLPEISVVTLDETTVARPQLTWTTTASLAATDGGFARLAWMTQGDAGAVQHGWSFVLPPSAVSVRAPAMPASAAEYLPQAAGQMIEPTIGFVESTLLPGYPQLRAGYAGFASPTLAPNSRTVTPLMPAAGTTRVTAHMAGGG